LKEKPQQALGFIHDGQKIWIKVANARGSHGLKDSWGHIARSRSHEYSFPRINIYEFIGIYVHFVPPFKYDLMIESNHTGRIFQTAAV
jgi:hypothetical protein